MLRKWGLSNFKSIKNADIELAPLTILTGTNSSGKSSLIQSILLIAQTLRNPIRSRKLVLNGQLTKMGLLKDIQAYDNDVGISFTCCDLSSINNGILEKSTPMGDGVAKIMSGTVAGGALGMLFGGPIGGLIGGALGGALTRTALLTRPDKRLQEPDELVPEFSKLRCEIKFDYSGRY